MLPPPQPTTTSPTGELRLGPPIVGVGCSAGGLGALEKLLGAVPRDSGLAFVVIQHLDPVHPSALPEILQRATTLLVAEASDGVVVEANRVYVVPPNKNLSLAQGVLHVLDPVEPRGHRLAIDFFLRSLAEDRQERAVGVLLSGMGSDGRLGLEAIREHGGLTLAQSPQSAEWSDMPRHAIDAGVVDFVAPPEEMAARILGYLGHERRGAGDDDDEARDALERAVLLVRERSGSDFSLYKPKTLRRRIERRMALHHLGTVEEYVRFLRANEGELDLLFKELLIGVTSFFRDPPVWEYLQSVAIPALARGFVRGQTLRAWVPACSSGEEAYSLAIVLNEVLEHLPPEARFAFQIYATDLDPEAIEHARRGVYPQELASQISPERLKRHFVAENGRYRVSRSVRERIVFAPQNILADPPFTRLDLLSCRNLLIYLGAAAQRRLLPMFHHALNPGGYLVLGSAETVGSFGPLFAPASQKLRVYQRTSEGPAQRVAPIEPHPRASWDRGLSAARSRPEPSESLGRLVDELIQQTLAPPAVLVDQDGDILYISGRTGKYLEPAAGKVNVNLHAMARPGLRDALATALFRARQEGVVRLSGLRVEEHAVDVVISLLDAPEALRGRFLVVFRDVAPAGASGEGKRTPAELASDEAAIAREALYNLQLEARLSLANLEAANEELQSTNEELQSTNEELISSKEELQSLNEELQTVNAELQAKVQELTSVHNDMSNLLNSTEIATVFLDEQLRVRRFTPDATRLFKLIPSDLGRPLADVATSLHYAELQDDARQVLRTLVFQEKAVKTPAGRWYRARIMPYRTQDNVIDGVVITFLDITELKGLEAAVARLQKPLSAE
jgi:two-component system CheB/CheR fusion protein